MCGDGYRTLVQFTVMQCGVFSKSFCIDSADDN